MVDKVIRKYAQERNLVEMGDAVVKTGGDMEMSYSYMPNVGWTVNVAVDPGTWNKDVFKELRKMAKGVGTIQFQEGAVVLAVRASSQNGKIDKLDQATEFLRASLPQVGVQPSKACHFCKSDNCDDKYVLGGVMYPAHASCKKQQADMIYAEVAENTQNGNMVLAIIMALVGGIVGCLPTLATIYFMDGTYFMYAFILIPLGAHFGYKIGKGVMNGLVPVIVAIISLFCTIALVVVGQYVYEIVLEGFAMKFGDFFEIFMNHPIYKAARVEMFAMPLVFCIVGIAISWGQIRQGNKQKLAAAEALRQSAQTPQGPQ